MTKVYNRAKEDSIDVLYQYQEKDMPSERSEFKTSKYLLIFLFLLELRLQKFHFNFKIKR